LPLTEAGTLDRILEHDISVTSRPSSPSFGDSVGGGAWTQVIGNYPCTGPLAQSKPAGFYFVTATPDLPQQSQAKEEKEEEDNAD
jgi:hypothetical protein